MHKEKIFTILFESILILISSTICFADRSIYQEFVNSRVENNDIIVIYYHDWSKHTLKERDKMITTHQNPFTDENDYADIECIDKKEGKQLFKKPTPALTYIYISEDSNYIVGISKIKVDNPYQFVVFDKSGNLLEKKHIAPSEAKLTLSEYEEFKKKYPVSNKILKSLDRFTIKADMVYIDFMSMNMPRKLGKAWDYLLEKMSVSHFSKSFSETVTNWIFWYKEPDPEIELKYNECQQLIAISLLDPKGERFEIPIKPGKKF